MAQLSMFDFIPANEAQADEIPVFKEEYAQVQSQEPSPETESNSSAITQPEETPRTRRHY